MATFRHATVPRFSTGGFEFTKNEMKIPDTEVERLAKWRRIWAKLPIKWRVNIVEVVEKDEYGRIRESSGIRGIGTAKLGAPDTASMTQQAGSQPANTPGANEPNEAPDRIPVKPNVPGSAPVATAVGSVSPVKSVGTFDHDGDGKAGGSKPLPKAGEAGFIKVPALKL